MKETFKEGGYKHTASLGGGQHLLLNLLTKESEVWYCNKNHASYGLVYLNTHLEFAYSLGKNSVS